MEVPLLFKCLVFTFASATITFQAFLIHLYTVTKLVQEMHSLTHLPQKKARNITCHSTNKPKPRRNQHVLPSQVFEGYKSLSERPVNIPMSIRSCWEKSVESLKKKGNSLPAVVPHPHRALLAHYSSRITGCMPHNTFTIPLHPPLRPGYSLQYLIL